MKQIIVFLLFATLFSCANKSVFYIDSVTGDDSNSGNSPQQAWASFERLKEVSFEPGTKILLAAGSTFKGEIVLENVSGGPENPVEITAYNLEENGNLPLIDSKGFGNGILINNCSYLTISNIEIAGNGGGVASSNDPRKNMHCGILVTTSKKGEFKNIKLSSLKIRDMFFEDEGFKRGKNEVRTANGSQSYGWGIRVINPTENAILSDVVVENCIITNVAHTGIKFTGKNRNIYRVKLSNNQVIESGGPGMQMSGVKDAHVCHNSVSYSGSPNDSRKWGRGSGLWTWGCADILIEHNSFRKANGPGDSAGCHIDFNCENVVVQYNLSEGNAGGFCEILGNNYNCAYRYNISINDGHRVKGKDGAFQEGKIFWLSGFQGKGRKRSGPFNSYFYNNTIYVSKDIVAKIAVDRASSGVLIANNIFCFEGESIEVKGDQYKPETEGESRVEKIIFKNNLYLNNSGWPEKVLIQDSKPIFGSPDYKNPGGIKAEDYIPQNTELIKNKGIQVQKIPEDKIGLTLGLEVKKDFLGNPIRDLPDLGAVELN